MNCQPLKYILMDCYALHTPTKTQPVSEDFLYKCVKRLDLSGVALNLCFPEHMFLYCD